MQHGSSAIATPGSEEPGHLDRPGEGCCLEPAGGFAQGHDSDFHLYFAQRTGFHLFGGMLQHSFTDGHPGGRVAQYLALDQLAGEFDAVQPFFPCN